MKTTAVYSPIGGVGKSVIALSYAYKYMMLGEKVLLVDLATFGSLSFYLRMPNTFTGLNRLTSLYSESEIDVDTLHDEIMEQAIESINKSNRFYLLAAANIVKMDKLSYQSVNDLLQALRMTWFDRIIFDTSSDVHMRNIALFENVDDIKLIVSQSMIDLWHIKSLKEVLDDVFIATDKISYILNKTNSGTAYNKDESEKFLNCTFSSVIPYKDNRITNYLNRLTKKQVNHDLKLFRSIRKHLQ